jgi:hypothetical protein
MARPQGGLGGIIWRASVRKGFFGSSRLWTTIFAVSAAVKFFRRISGGTADVVYTEALAPGQALLITHHADLLHGDKSR